MNTKREKISSLLVMIMMLAGGLFIYLDRQYFADEIPGETQVANLTTNWQDYEAGGSTEASPKVPKYEKFELTFDVEWYKDKQFGDPTQKYDPLTKEWDDEDNKSGDYIKLNNKIYKCIQDIPTTWKVKDKYNLNDIVRYNNKIYKSIKEGEQEAYTASFADYIQWQNYSDGGGHLEDYPRPEDNEPGTLAGNECWQEISNFDVKPGTGANWTEYWQETDIKPVNPYWPYDESPDSNNAQWSDKEYYLTNTRVVNNGKYYEVKKGIAYAGPGDPEPGGSGDWQSKWTDQVDVSWEPVPVKTGISVDGIFTNSNGETITQPAFYFMDYERSQFVLGDQGNKQWLYPKGKAVWKIRFAPKTEGTWTYTIQVRDATGLTTYASESSNVFVSSSIAENPGFLQKSETDPRYFETSEGQYINVNAINARGYPDTYDIENKYPVLKDSGFNLLRAWWQVTSSPAIMFGLKGQGGYTANWNGMSLSTVGPEGKLFSSELSSGNSINVSPNLIPYHRYRFSALVKTESITGREDLGVYLSAMHDRDWKPIFTSKKLNGNSDWTLLTTDFYNEYFLWGRLEKEDWYKASDLRIAMTPETEGKAYVTNISVKEIMSDNSLGDELMWRPNFDIQQSVPQGDAWEADFMVDQAHKYNLYLKIVLGEHIDNAFNMIQANGKSGEYLPGDVNFYGGWGHHASRVYQHYYWRYIIARYGYSTNIHSFEFCNEADPNNGNFLNGAYDFNRFFYTYDPNRHMAISSTYHTLHNQDVYEYADWHSPAGFPDSVFFNHYIPDWKSGNGEYCKNIINYNYNDYSADYLGYTGPPGNLHIINDERSMGFPQFRETGGGACGVDSENIAVMPGHKYKVTWKVKANGVRAPELKDPSYSYLSGAAGGFYYSNDASTWENLQIPDTGEWTSKPITDIKLAPNGSYFAVAGAWYHRDRGLYRSTDNGSTWTRVGLKDSSGNFTREGSSGRFFHTIIAQNGDIYLATETDGLYRGTNNGETWQKVKGPDNDVSKQLNDNEVMSVFVSSNNVIFAGTDTNIYYSTDSGANWTKIIQQEIEQKHFNIFGETKDGKIMAGTRSGIYISGGDFNNGWSKVADSVVTEFAKNAAGDIFASTMGQSVIKSTNNGSSWFSIKNDLGGDSFSTGDYLYTVFVNPTNQSVYLGGPRGTFYLSDNGGSNWRLLNNNIKADSIRSIMVAPDGKIWLGGIATKITGTNGIPTIKIKKDGGSILFPNSDNIAEWTGTYDWKETSYEFNVETNVKYINLTPVIDGLGEAWFDDIELFDLTDNKPVNMSNGSFDRGRVDYDLAGFLDSLALIVGKTNNRVVNKPLIMGETGVVEYFKYAGEGIVNPYIKSDHDGLWYKKMVWGQINPGAVIPEIELGLPEVWNYGLKYPKSYQGFMKGIDLDNGKYEDISASTSDSAIHVFGQKDLTNNKAHLWIDNANYNWKAVVDHKGVNAWDPVAEYWLGDVVNYNGKIYQSIFKSANCNKNNLPTDTNYWVYVYDWESKPLPPPVTGTVTIPNMKAGNYHLAWYNTTTGAIDHEEDLATNGTNLNIPVANLASDIALKVEIISVTPVSILNSKTFTYKTAYKVDGTKSADIIKVLVNGSEAELDNTNNTWTTNIDLAIGQNTITAIGEDAFGSQSAPSTYTISRRKMADANDDGSVGLIDLSILSANWRKTGQDNPADFNEDGSIGLIDLSIMSANWRK